MRRLPIVAFIIALLASASNSQDCAASLSSIRVSDEMLANEITRFYAAGGCLLQVDSISNRDFPGPFFVITRLNDSNIERPNKFWAFNFDQPRARKTIEAIFDSKDWLLIYNHMMSAEGAVADRQVDRGLFAGLDRSLAGKLDMVGVDRLFALGYDASMRTVVHEAHHVEELKAGRLYRIRNGANDVIKKLQARYPKRSNEILALFRNLHDYAAELPAINAEFEFLSEQGQAESASFLEYIAKGPHDHVRSLASRREQIAQLLVGEDDAQSIGLSACYYLKWVFTDSNLEKDYRFLFDACF